MPLRTFDESRDANTLRSWLADPEAARWLAGSEHASLMHGNGRVTRWIFEQNGVPLGYGDMLEAAGGTYVQVLRVVVDPARRRQRIGTALVRELIAQARSLAPAQPVYAGIAPDNLPALWACPAAGLVPLEPLPGGFDESLVWLTTLDDEHLVPGGPIEDEG